MKKLRVTVNGTTYEVEVELLEDDENEGFNTQYNQSLPKVNQVQQAAINIPKATQSVVGGNGVFAPMAGNITVINVKSGQKVKQNDVVAEMEAMKMITKLTAPRDGVVKSVNVSVGDNINQGDAIVTFE